MTLIERPRAISEGRHSRLPLETRLPRTRFEALAAEQGGTVTFITEWLATHADRNPCDACEGLGFCLRCDARGCADCHGGLCELCNGIGLSLETVRS
jgi:hypothetical protein